MRFFNRFDIGWLYLLCGLTFTISAIVLPAQSDLKDLILKRDAIYADANEQEYRVGVYADFLADVRAGDPLLLQRLIQMQFNQSPEGTAVVIDRTAPKTPLAWVAQRANRVRVLPMETAEISMLSMFASGDGRLWLLGLGAFALFIGLVTTPTNCK